MRDYFHATGRYALEREVLTMIGRFLGQNGNPQWIFQYLDSLIADRRLKKAKILLDRIKEKSPESFEAWLGEGLLYKAQGQLQAAMESFRQASHLNPKSFRVHLEMAKTLRDLKMNKSAQTAFLKTQSHVTNVREKMALAQELNRNK
jgi:tetratricopeptide (TPR) repeat protein